MLFDGWAFTCSKILYAECTSKVIVFQCGVICRNNVKYIFRRKCFSCLSCPLRNLTIRQKEVLLLNLPAVGASTTPRKQCSRGFCQGVSYSQNAATKLIKKANARKYKNHFPTFRNALNVFANSLSSSSLILKMQFEFRFEIRPRRKTRV